MSLLPKSPLARSVLVIAALAALAVGWYLASPLFIDRAVDEDFPTSMADDSLPDRVMDDAMPAGPRALASGRFSDADAVHKGEGAATLYRLDDGSAALRFEDFRVTNGPDLYVWVSDAGPGATSDDIKNSKTIELAPLKGNVGSQNYILPADVNLDEVRSVVIWCRAFGVLFSQAPLDAAE